MFWSDNFYEINAAVETYLEVDYARRSEPLKTISNPAKKIYANFLQGYSEGFLETAHFDWNRRRRIADLGDKPIKLSNDTVREMQRSRNETCLEAKEELERLLDSFDFEKFFEKYPDVDLSLAESSNEISEDPFDCENFLYSWIQDTPEIAEILEHEEELAAVFERAAYFYGELRGILSVLEALKIPEVEYCDDNDSEINDYDEDGTPYGEFDDEDDTSFDDGDEDEDIDSSSDAYCFRNATGEAFSKFDDDGDDGMDYFEPRGREDVYFEICDTYVYKGLDSFSTLAYL